MRSTADWMERPSPGSCPRRRPSTTSAFHRADLLDVLLANLPGDVVRLGQRCIGFEQDDEHAIVVFATGARVTADVVVGADGIHSTLQPHVAAVPEPIHSGSTAYRGVITTESVSWPPGTARLWMGEGKHFLAYCASPKRRRLARTFWDPWISAPSRA